LLPALSKARQQAWQVQCASNERQILMAMFMYADANRGVLPLPLFNPNQLGGIAIWMTNDGQYDYQNGVLWPYVGTKDPMGRERLFSCPADLEPRIWINYGSPRPTGPRNFSYNFNYQLYIDLSSDFGTINHGWGIGVHLSRVNGSDHKILVIEEKAPSQEADVNVGIYMASNPALAINNENPFSDRHNHCANMGMADGHVELLGPNDLPPVTLASNKGRIVLNPTPKFYYYIQLPHF
jgi:prepilin-type processing-associated H-X9-DG protein